MLRAKVSVLALAAVLAAGAARAQHEGHTPAPGPAQEPNLFQSDMSLMTGQTSLDPMGGMEMPGWMTHVMGVARLSLNHQGGPSGSELVESSNWNMVMAQRFLGPGLLGEPALGPTTFMGSTRASAWT